MSSIPTCLTKVEALQLHGDPAANSGSHDPFYTPGTSVTLQCLPDSGFEEDTAVKHGPLQYTFWVWQIGTPDPWTSVQIR